MDAQAVKALYEAMARIISARGEVTVRVVCVREKEPGGEQPAPVPRDGPLG